MDSSHKCIEWEGWRDRDGYGLTKVRGKLRRAHRVSWEKEHGPIPDGLVIDHLCKNRACQNTEHMELVTNAENLRRGRWGTATHCIHGHPFDEANTYHSNQGKRQCRTCQRIRTRKRRARV